jgi:hypothetical protein
MCISFWELPAASREESPDVRILILADSLAFPAAKLLEMHSLFLFSSAKQYYISQPV